jgi:hypothetical protein
LSILHKILDRLRYIEQNKATQAAEKEKKQEQIEQERTLVTAQEILEHQEELVAEIEEQSSLKNYSQPKDRRNVNQRIRRYNSLQSSHQP